MARRAGWRFAAALATASVIAVTGGFTEGASAETSVTCSASMHRFVNTLTEIDGRLDVGLNFREYRNLLAKAEVSYERVAPNRQSFRCGRYVGVPAERAINQYQVAYNIWAKCINGVAPSCGPETSTGRSLQLGWRLAHQNVRQAVMNLTP